MPLEGHLVEMGGGMGGLNFLFDLSKIVAAVFVPPQKEICTAEL